MPDTILAHLKLMDAELEKHLTEGEIAATVAAVVAHRDKARTELGKLAEEHDLRLVEGCWCYFCVLVRRMRPDRETLREEWEVERGH